MCNTKTPSTEVEAWLCVRARAFNCSLLIDGPDTQDPVLTIITVTT